MSWVLGKFSSHQDDRGELGVLEFQQEFDFIVKRIFFMRGMNNGVVRGGHTHEDLLQAVVCLAGSFSIKLDDGKTEQIKTMHSKNNEYLILNGLVWRDLFDFSPDALVLVACDKIYCEDRVIRDYSRFQRMVK